ncbi:MAG: PTS system mannose/fructose/sorbose family transporter subunit IID [Elusimicrobia bacterium]|nr:PTS system mannose/fructose/sorbose family transporter subunit IID [Elusimicrobiota bacterium]
MTGMGPGMRLRLFLRSLFVQSLWSFENMQGLGFGMCLEPWLGKVWKDAPAEGRRALARHCEHFNTNPYMTGLVLGMAASLEEAAAAAAGEARPGLEGRQRTLKAAASSALAALGDSFFWGAWRPFCAIFAVAAGVLGVILGGRTVTVILAAAGFYVLAYAAPVLALRWQGLSLGYRWGERFAQELSRYPFQRLIKATRMTGLCLALGCAGIAIFSIMSASSLPRAGVVAAAVAGGWAARAYGLTARRLYAAVGAVGVLAAMAGLRW